jgi:glycosyltransferase involved in cell wall biosynthesis
VTIHFVYCAFPERTLRARVRRRLAVQAQKRGLPLSYVGDRAAPDTSRWARRSPFSITVHLLDALRAKGADVRLYDWTERLSIPAGPQDVILGHPFPDDARVFNRSVLEGRGGARIALVPLSHRQPDVNQYVDPLVPRVDHVIGIMGPYWWDTWGESCFAHWLPKLSPLDMAIDAAHFPRVKTRFNPPGERKFLVLGVDNPTKGVHLASVLFGLAAPRHRAVWIGQGRPLPHLECRGFADLTPDYVRRLAEEVDVFVTLGLSDPNPTTILECMAWGFPVLVTPQAGYHRVPEMTEMSISDMRHDLAVLDRFQELPEADLLALADAGRARVERDYSFERFTGEVIAQVERVARAKGIDPWRR